MTTREKIEEAVINFVKGGDNRDTVVLDNVLHKDFRVTNNGFMGTAGIAIIDKQNISAKYQRRHFWQAPQNNKN